MLLHSHYTSRIYNVEEKQNEMVDPPVMAIPENPEVSKEINSETGEAQTEIKTPLK